MLAAIRGARETINFETYIYWSGAIGKEFADALAERARAGVKVHVLLDWVGSQKMEEALVAEMKSAGVEIQKYHPLHWSHLGRLNNRTHRKLLVVDGRVGFTGGVGIAEQWSGDAQDPEHWRDTHFQVEGPVVAQMQAVFMDNWIKTTGAVLHGADYFPPLEPVGRGAAQVFSSSPSGGSASMELMYLMSITAAKRTIRLSSSYFVPNELAVADDGRGDEARREAADHHARRAHRHRDRARRLARALGRPARRRRRDLRVPADDVPLQGDDRRRVHGLDRIDQLRRPLVPAQRRGQPQHLRRRVRAPSRRRSSAPTWRSRAASPWPSGRRGR